MSTPFRRIAFLLFAALVIGAPALHAQREKLPLEDLDIVEKKWPGAKRTYTGLRYIIMKPGKEGEKDSPVPGNFVKVLYKGSLLNGNVFDQTPDADHALKVRIGRSQLIDGWDQALQKMHRGEKWLLIVPPEMAYGARGKPPMIPRNATLVFEMELLDFGEDIK